MTPSSEFDRRISAWLDDGRPTRAPDHLLADSLALTDRTRPRPAWRIPERWIPMRLQTWYAVAPRAVLIAATLIVVAALAAAGAVGASLLPTKVPPPTGPARNGLIAFDTAGDIWVVNPDGSSLRQLTSGPAVDLGPVWSPDGTWIAFWSIDMSSFDEPYTDVQIQVTMGQPKASLVLVSADGSDQRVLAGGLRVAGSCAPVVSWSPDSSRIAYGHRDLTDTITVVSVEDATSVSLDVLGYGPSWSPDGTTVAFHGTPGMVGGTSQQAGVYLIEVDGSGLRKVSTTTGSGCGFDYPQWSPDGTRIAYYDGVDGGHSIRIANVDGSGELVFERGGTGEEYWPRWSPDGSRIAFDRVVEICCNRVRVVLADPDGANQVMLDHAPWTGGWPTWSPDGTMILGFDEDAAAEVLGFTIIDVVDSSPRGTIPARDGWGYPSWQRLAP
jgi:Tol biopolymer transport system component